MGRVAAVLCLCLLLAGCSVHGPGHEGSLYWSFAPEDDFGAYVWKPVANLGLTIAYAAYVTLYAFIQCAAACGGCR